jgi:hypothetical protein
LKYFLPDSQDLVDPSFDFETERRSTVRLRQRDDLYAHELFAERAFDGILVSKGIVDGFGGTGGRYTLAQRHRLLRSGAHEFFRTSGARCGALPIMGDCGAFTYLKEKTPPYSVDDVMQFYEECQFDYGISVDHVILSYRPDWDGAGNQTFAPEDVRERQLVTLELARDFWDRHQRTKPRFSPVGVAQGWSPKSYAHAVSELQKIGYRYIAVGGMVPLKTIEILRSLEGIADVRLPATSLHLLGVTRTEHVAEMTRLGVGSFDSTSPLRKAFKDDKDNYYTPDRQFTAIRIPQVEGNPKLQKGISSGKVKQETARSLEKGSLLAMKRFDAGDLGLNDTLDALRRYEELYDKDGEDHTEVYRETLSERPWQKCGCEVCRDLRHHVILFRGAERNRRRGFHNTWVFYRRLQRDVAAISETAAPLRPVAPTQLLLREDEKESPRKIVAKTSAKARTA